MNIVINGKYKGYKIVFDKDSQSIQLKCRRNTVLLNGKVTSICITKNKLGTENIHYFEMADNVEKMYCLLDFSTYLKLIILGMKVPIECVLGNLYQM